MNLPIAISANMTVSDVRYIESAQDIRRQISYGNITTRIIYFTISKTYNYE